MTFGANRVAIDIPGSEHESPAVVCASCLLVLSKIEVGQSSYCCPGCELNICVMCGCTDAVSCPGGCQWIAPGICSTHEAALQGLVAKMFPAPMEVRG